MASNTTKRSSLTHFAWLSIAAAIVTIPLKAVAYLLTGSVGLLSDAMEAPVNLAGELMALAMLAIAARSADEDHAYGHSKAEYFSSGFEETLILIAAVGIGVAAIQRLLDGYGITDRSAKRYTKSVRTVSTNRRTLPFTPYSPIRSAPICISSCDRFWYMDSPAWSLTAGTYRNRALRRLAGCHSVHSTRINRRPGFLEFGKCAFNFENITGNPSLRNL